jgi:hypothetical protein
MVKNIYLLISFILLSYFWLIYDLSDHFCWPYWPPSWILSMGAKQECHNFVCNGQKHISNNFFYTLTLLSGWYVNFWSYIWLFWQAYLPPSWILCMITKQERQKWISKGQKHISNNFICAFIIFFGWYMTFLKFDHLWWTYWPPSWIWSMIAK